MKMKVLALALAAVMLLTATGCSAQAEAVTDLAKIDNTAWLYNADDDVYYQIGISYCENPADEKYETLAIFVPGAYMNATDNGDGTYTCEINPDGKVGSYCFGK